MLAKSSRNSDCVAFVSIALVTTVAWKAKPTYYIVADQDRMIAPELEKKFAEQMGAKTIHLASSHVPMLSHAIQVAEFISSAAASQ